MVTLLAPSASISATDGTVLMTFDIPQGLLEEVKKKNDTVSMDLQDDQDHKRHKYHPKCQEQKDNHNTHEDKIHKDREEDKDHNNCQEHKNCQDHTNPHKHQDNNNHQDHKTPPDQNNCPDHKNHLEHKNHGDYQTPVKAALSQLVGDKSSSSPSSRSLRSVRKRWREIGDKDRAEYEDRAKRAVLAHLHSLKTTYLQLQRVSW